MIFKILIQTKLLFYSTLSFSATDDIFRVAPYTLLQTNGHLFLNFQTSKDQSLIIEDNDEIKVSFNYKKNEQNKIELSLVPCGFAKEFKILEGK